MYNSSFKVRKDLIFSPRELLDIYFHGINIPTDDRAKLSDRALLFYLESAQTWIENTLSVKLTPQEYEENVTFYSHEWRQWGRVGTTFQVREALAMEGFVGSLSQIEYPVEWLSVKRSDGGFYTRAIFVVPVTNASVAFKSNDLVAAGVSPHRYLLNLGTIPNYWTVRYITGFEKIPSDLANVVGKYASINLFNILGDIVIGAGIASQSLGFDGLSQSISTTSSAENSAYSARIKQYLAELKEEIPRLQGVYGGLTLAVL